MAATEILEMRCILLELWFMVSVIPKMHHTSSYVQLQLCYIIGITIGSCFRLACRRPCTDRGQTEPTKCIPCNNRSLPNFIQIGRHLVGGRKICFRLTIEDDHAYDYNCKCN